MINSYSDNSISQQAVQHKYYLNIEHAYIEAEKQQVVVEKDGSESIQYCYYDGVLTDITLDNFIRVNNAHFVDFFSNNHLPIPTQIVYENGESFDLTLNSPDIIDEIESFRKNHTVSEYIHKDSYYIDELEALNTAKQKNRVYCGHPTVDGLQICYTHGNSISSSLSNFIHLELKEIIDFFTSSFLRKPVKIIFPDGLDEEMLASIQSSFEEGIAAATKYQDELLPELIQRAKKLKPNFHEEAPLRVFLPTSRLTEVMQYSTQGIAKAFEMMGYSSMVFIEKNDMESTNTINLLRQYIDFKPHYTVNINHLDNFYQHHDVINFSWWQDPMPSLRSEQKLVTRENDFIFSITSELDKMLKTCQVQKVFRQHFSYDSNVFHKNYQVKRENKIIFIGSKGFFPAIHSPKYTDVLLRMTEDMEKGTTFDRSYFQLISGIYHIDYKTLFWDFLYHIVRTNTTHWLCQSNTDLDVKIYGRGWQDDPLVASYFQGEVKHGKEVAKLYNSTKYAFISHPFEINSQRLAELSACGCIPVIYDCRDIAEKPHWDKHCLFFKTPDELSEILKGQPIPKENPVEISDSFTYKSLVKNFIETAEGK